MFAGFGCPSFLGGVFSMRLESLRACFQENPNVLLWTAKRYRSESVKHVITPPFDRRSFCLWVPLNIHMCFSWCLWLEPGHGATENPWKSEAERRFEAVQLPKGMSETGVFRDSESGDSKDPFWHTLETNKTVRQLVALPELELQLLPGFSQSHYLLLSMFPRALLRSWLWSLGVSWGNPFIHVYTVKWRFPKIGLPLVSIQFHGMFRRKKEKCYLHLSAVSSFMKPPNIILQPLERPVEVHFFPTDHFFGGNPMESLSSMSSPRTRQARRRRRKWPGDAWRSIAVCIHGILIPSGFSCFFFIDIGYSKWFRGFFLW